jgi:glycosyltransferase involved in cell wall biosynthesis
VRIAFVVNQLALGGAERQAADLALELARRGHHCVVFTFYGKLLLAEELEEGGVAVIPLQAGRRYWPGVPTLARHLRQGAFDVMNSHMSLAGALARVAALAARIPAVSVEQLPGGDEPLRVRMIRDLTLNAATSIVCISHEVRRQLYRGTNWYLLRRPPVHVVHNTVDVQAVRARAGDREHTRSIVGVGADAVVVSNVGRFHPQKNQLRLIRAFAAMAHEEPRASLVLVGWGSLEEALRREAWQLGIGNRVVIAVERRDAVAIVAASDVFVFPSLFEGLGVALLEAMAVGTPVVASSIAPITEVVQDGQEALLVDPLNEGMIGSAILRLVRDRALAASLAAAAARRVEEDFELRRAADAYEQVFHEVVSG